MYAGRAILANCDRDGICQATSPNDSNIQDAAVKSLYFLSVTNNINFHIENNKSTDQSARMHILVCVFVVCMQ